MVVTNDPNLPLDESRHSIRASPLAIATAFISKPDEPVLERSLQK
jgi:hypothetical protein